MTITYQGYELNQEGNYFLKPAGCEGCPFAHKGRYFTPDRIVKGSTVTFIAQGPGEQEEAGRYLYSREWARARPQNVYVQVTPQPLIGPTGHMFETQFLPLSGLKRDEVSLANILRCRPGKGLGLAPNDLPPLTKTMKLETSKADIVKAIRHCTTTYFRPPPSTELIVTMGRYAMFGLTGIQKEDTEYGGKSGVMEAWRGYGVDVSSFEDMKTVDTSHYHPFLKGGKRIFFTMHLAALFQGEQNKRFFHAALLDFAKIKAILQGRWPSSSPTFSRIPPTVWPNYAAFDTEYDVHNDNALQRWSLCDSDYNVYSVDVAEVPVIDQITVAPKSTIITQNGKVDIPHLQKIADLSHVTLEDMMLAHSILYTGEPHNLNYIQSKYGSLNRHKHLMEDEPAFYAAIDAHQPMYIWLNHFLPEFKRDTMSWKVYRKYTLPLLPIIMKAEKFGVPINTEKLAETHTILHNRIAEYQSEAQALTGKETFNLGGRIDMMKEMYGDDTI